MASLSPNRATAEAAAAPSPVLSPKSTAVASADVPAPAAAAASSSSSSSSPLAAEAGSKVSVTTAGASSLLPSSSSPCAKTAITNGGSGLLTSSFSLTSPQATASQQQRSPPSYLNANPPASATVAVDSTKTKRVAEQHPSQYQHQKLSSVLSSLSSNDSPPPLLSSSSAAASTGLLGQPSINGSNQGSSANATPPTPIASSTGAALVMGKSITSTTNSSTMPVSTTTVPIGGGVSSITATSNNHHSAANINFSMSGRCGPSMIHYKNLRFLITDKPTDATLSHYIDELKRRQATDVVRVCESTYSAKRLEKAGIKCHDWAFDDGTPPPPKIINDWLDLIIERFKDLPANSGGNSGDSQQNIPCIAVHCVAGLGRAPVLVAIALIEAGMKYEDAVEMIRDVRRGAINAKQLQYLSQYKPKKVLVFVSSNSKRKFCCII